jgi:hypothetical protein
VTPGTSTATRPTARRSHAGPASRPPARRCRTRPALPDLLVHPLNYNPANGEEMRLLNPSYPGGEFDVPDELFQDLDRDPTGNTWNWSFRTVRGHAGRGPRRGDGDRLQRPGRARSVHLRDEPGAGAARRAPRCAATIPASPTTAGSASSTRVGIRRRRSAA